MKKENELTRNRRQRKQLANYLQ